MVDTVFYTRDQAAHAIARYIDGFHNTVRRHSALDYSCPAQF
ncbi:IS3 family transposase [Sphingomonas sp. CJ20]